MSDSSLTAFNNWSSGNHHVATGVNVFVPVGSYDENRIINLGRNHWSFDPVVTWTGLDPERGHEMSATTGVVVGSSANEFLVRPYRACVPENGS